MADLKLNFLHPTGGQVLAVTLDDSFTTNEIVAELIANDFIAASRDGYHLAVAAGSQLQATQTLAQAGVRDNDKIHIVPATDAGYAKCTNKLGPPANGRTKSRDRKSVV